MKKFSKFFLVASFLFFTVFLSYPKAYADGVYVEWQIPFLPIVLTVGEDGIEISGAASILTPIGTFKVGYSKDLIDSGKNDLILVIRNTRLWGDEVYKIKNGKDLSVFTNGRTIVQTRSKENTVIVDVTHSKSMKIQFLDSEKILGDNLSVPLEFKIFYRENRGDKFTILRDGDSIKSDSRMKVSFKVDREAYIYIFNSDQEGLLVRLFPNTEVKGEYEINSNPVNKGTNVFLPSEKRSYVLDSSKGTGYIYFLALKKRDLFLETGNEKSIDYFHEKYSNYFNRATFYSR